MSTYQVASRAKLDPSTIRGAEAREEAGAITLDKLREMAGTLECDVFYILLPKRGSLEDTLEARAHAVAKALLGPVQQTMLLEAQRTSAEQYGEQVQELAEELVRTESRELWSTDVLG